VLQRRFPAIVGPHKEDICYATTNRQEAVKAIAPRRRVIVVGAPNSSNSQRLVEVARARRLPAAACLVSARRHRLGRLEGVAALGVTAGASAPEMLVEEIIDACASAST
jgi:4-hydroxy-3-methylbut-2-en-1-yl diphosphate reductase